MTWLRVELGSLSDLAASYLAATNAWDDPILQAEARTSSGRERRDGRDDCHQACTCRAKAVHPSRTGAAAAC